MKWLINFSALKSRRLVKPLPQLWREILNLWHWHQNKFWLVRSTSFRMNPWWVTRYVSECSLKERLFQWRGLHASKLSVSEECSIEWTSVAWRGCVWYKGSESNWTLCWRRVEWKKKVWLRRYLPCPQSSSVEHLPRTGYQKVHHLLRICISSFPSSLWQWSLCGALATTFVTYLVVTFTQWVMIGQTLQ